MKRSPPPPRDGMEHAGSLLAEIDMLLAIDRYGSATKAAAHVKTTTATVLRRLEALEETLGVALFDRLATGMRATPAMALVRPWAEQAEAIGVSMASELQRVEQQASGVVRLAVPPALATLVLIPALSALRAAFPDIVLELAPATAPVDLVMREADLAVRTMRPEQGDLVFQRITTAKVIVACSPRLARKHARLEDLPWLAWDASLARIPEMVWLRERVPNAAIVFRSTELTALLHAAKGGIGALVVAEPLAVRTGGLVCFETGTPMPEHALWLVTHRALRAVPRVAAVWDWVASTFDGVDPPREARSFTALQK